MDNQPWYVKLKRERLRRGWTQEEVANKIGSNPKTVSRWEQGNTSLPGNYLRQKLAEVFNMSIEELGLVYEQDLEETEETSGPTSSISRQADWGDAPHIGQLLGRAKQLTDVSRWLLEDGCRMIAVMGIGGIGKTTFATMIARNLQYSFNTVYWRSLQHAPSIERFLESYLQFVFHTRHAEVPKELNEQLALLISVLQEQRCLLILDNFESVLSAGQSAGRYRQGYEGYGRLLRLVGETDHRSCLILTSREKPGEVIRMEGKNATVRALQLEGIGHIDGRKLLENSELFGTDETWEHLVRLYAGNPLALKLVADFIQTVFGGDIASFLQEEAAVFGDIDRLLAEQFSRLGELEQAVMYWLALEREALPVHELLAKILHVGTRGAIFEAIDSLGRRSLIETRDNGHLTLQAVIMEYVTNILIEHIYSEIVTEQVGLLHSHTLMQAEAKDYVRNNQERFILQPLVEKLKATFSKVDIETKLLHVLSTLRKQGETTSYAAGNILNLLVQLQVDLRGYDFSDLAVRQAYLQGVDLYDVNFSRADLKGSVFTDTFSTILCVAVASNGNLLAAGTTTGEVRLWQAESVTPLFTCTGHADGIRSVAFSPDGKLLVSGSEDFTLRLWDTNTGVCLRILQGHTGMVRAVAFSSDGWTIASGSEDATVRIWDATTGHNLHILQGHGGWVRSVAFNIDGNTIASGGDDETVRLWDTSTGNSTAIMQGHSAAVRVVAFSPDGGTLASGGDDTTLRIWDASTGDSLMVLQGHTDLVRAIAFSSDGMLLASSSDDQIISLWDTSTGSQVKILHAQSNRIWSLAFFPDNNTLVSASESAGEDDTLRYWDVRQGQCTRKLRGFNNLIKSVAFSPDGQTIVSGDEDANLRLWDVESGRCIKVLQGHTNRIRSVAFHPNGRTVASGSEDEIVRVWDVQSGLCRMILRGHTHLIRSVAFSTDGNLIASGSHDQTIRVWDAKMGQCLHILQGQNSVIWSVAFSPDARLIASGHDDGLVRIWNVPRKECLKALEGHTSRVWSVAFSPDGRTIASAGDDMTIRIWDVDAGSVFRLPTDSVLACGSGSRIGMINRVPTGQCLQTLHGHTLWVRSVAFHPDGNLLASGSHDTTVRLWESNTGKCLKTLHGHSNCVWSVAFSPDGRTIASAGDDGSIKIWDVETGACISTLRSERPYERMNITQVKGLTESQKVSLHILGAIEEG